jgi:hypothetical protein
MSWERSERAVGAKALARAVESYGATVTDLLAVTGDPVRDLRAAKESARQNAAAERERAAAALHDVGVPATTASAWLDRRGLPAAGNGQLLDLAGRCARVWSALPQLATGRILLTVLAATALGRSAYARILQGSSPRPISSASFLVRLSASTGVLRPPRSACSLASTKAGRQSTSVPTKTPPARR